MFTVILVLGPTLRSLAAEPSLKGIVDPSPVQEIPLRASVPASEALRWARQYAASGLYDRTGVRCGKRTIWVG